MLLMWRPHKLLSLYKYVEVFMKLGGKCKLVRITDKFLFPKVANYFFAFKQTDLKLEHTKKKLLEYLDFKII